MAMGLKHDPYSQPREFMDDIINEMKEGYNFHVAEAQRQIREEVQARLAEIDASVTPPAQDVRMACVGLVINHLNIASIKDAVSDADALAQYVLTGKKPGAEG